MNSFKKFFKIAASSDDYFHDDGSGRVFWGKQAAGVLIVCQEDKTMLLLKRSSNVEEPGTWGTAGGAIGQEENPQDGANREAKEELGSLPKYKELLHSFVYTSGTFKYTTFVYDIGLAEKKNWTQSIYLNWENDEYRWFPFDSLPSNLHFGLEFLRNKLEEVGLDEISEPKGIYDWLIKAIKNLHQEHKLPLEEGKKYIQLIPKEISEYKWDEIDEINSKLILALSPISKFLLSQKDAIGARKVLDIKNKLKIRTNTNDLNKPKQERSSFNQFLYHGLPAADAYSVLQTKKFIKNSAFDRVSFTSDLLIAAKFGDVALVFDGKRLQRKYQARKMNYITNKQQEQLDYAKNNEDSKRPKISNIFAYEKEWSIFTPFQFEDADLIKIIVFFYDEKTKSMSKRIKGMLETTTDKPVQLVSVPSYSGQIPKVTSPSDLEVKDLRTNIATNVSGPLQQFISEARVLIEKIKKYYKDKYKLDKDDDILYFLRNTSIYNNVNYVYREMQGNVNLLKESNYYSSDLDRFEKVVEVVSNAYESLKNDNSFPNESSKLAQYLKQVLDSSESIKNAFVDKFMSEDDKIIETIFSKSYGMAKAYWDKLENWINQHPEFIINTIRENNLNKSNMYEKEDGKSYSRLIDLLRRIKNPNIIPDDIWIKFPFELIDSDYIENIPTEKLISILKQVKNLHDKSVDHWIEDHRLEYAKGAKKQKLQDVIDAIRSESQID